MDPISSAVASGMRARLESLDLLANNLANANTRGFKADREFYTLYVAEEPAAMGGDKLSMPLIERTWTDHSQGLLQPSGNPLDLALNGKGFFCVEGPRGLLYTRNGSFQVSPKGFIQTNEGFNVRGINGKPIVVSPGLPIQVDKNGNVSQESALVGQLLLHSFEDQRSLVKYGLNYYTPTISDTPTKAPADTEVRQGYTEDSNVGAAESMVRLVTVLRQFEALQKALALNGEMNRKAIEEVAKITP